MIFESTWVGKFIVKAGGLVPPENKYYISSFRKIPHLFRKILNSYLA